MFVIKALGVVQRKPILGMGCLFAAIATSLSCGGSSPAAQVVPPVNKTVDGCSDQPYKRHDSCGWNSAIHGHGNVQR